MGETPFDLEREVEEEGDLPKIIAHKCRAESPYDVNIVDVANTPPEQKRNERYLLLSDGALKWRGCAHL